MKYTIIFVLIPLIYVRSYGHYCWKKGDKLAALGAFISAAVPFILAFLIIIYQ